MEKEKIIQAQSVLVESDVDLWMVVDRESESSPDPMLDYVVGGSITWLSFFLFYRNGNKIAIVGNLDVEKIERKGLFDQVIGYRGSPREALLESLNRHKPRKIALDYSLDSPTADGLTHGCFLSLLELLKGTGYPATFISAEMVISRLIGRKSSEEQRRLLNAVKAAEEIFAKIGTWAKPGMTEQELAACILEDTKKRGLQPGWAEEHCPAVFFGPQKGGAHSSPTETRLQRGHVFNVDFGVRREKYCSDLQRTWYVMKVGEEKVPIEVNQAFATIVKSIDAGFRKIRPGIKGEEIDTAARQVITSSGYDEYPHALGHQVGRSAHDGGAMLAPTWERYGNLPFIPLEAGQVFTLEPRINLPEFGVVTVEEMICITEDGACYLSHPQKEIWILQ